MLCKWPQVPTRGTQHLSLCRTDWPPREALHPLSCSVGALEVTEDKEDSRTAPLQGVEGLWNQRVPQRGQHGDRNCTRSTLTQPLLLTLLPLHTQLRQPCIAGSVQGWLWTPHRLSLFPYPVTVTVSFRSSPHGTSQVPRAPRGGEAGAAAGGAGGSDSSAITLFLSHKICWVCRELTTTQRRERAHLQHRTSHVYGFVWQCMKAQLYSWDPQCLCWDALFLLGEILVLAAPPCPELLFTFSVEGDTSIQRLSTAPRPSWQHDCCQSKTLSSQIIFLEQQWQPLPRIHLYKPRWSSNGSIWQIKIIPLPFYLRPLGRIVWDVRKVSQLFIFRLFTF